MPVYNSAAWLETSISSLLAQTYGDFELIVSDNASNDGTVDLCARLAAQDRRIRFVRQPRNIGANRNYLAVQRLARGQYFKWAASNDWCAPTFLQRCVAALENDSAAVLATPLAYTFEQDLRDARPYEFELELNADSAVDRFRQYFLQTSGLNNAMNGVLRTAVLQSCQPLGVFGQADIVLMAELAMHGKFVQVRERLFYRRIAPAAATSFRTPREAELHLAPESRAPLRWQRWKYHWNIVRAVARTIPFGTQQLRALEFALRSMYWARRELIADVRQGLFAGENR